MARIEGSGKDSKSTTGSPKKFSIIRARKENNYSFASQSTSDLLSGVRGSGQDILFFWSSSFGMKEVRKIPDAHPFTNR